MKKHKIHLTRVTVFNTFFISKLIKLACQFFVWIANWKITGDIPPQKSCVVIAVPHQKWYDMPMTLIMFFMCNWKVYWLGKKEIFRFPFGFFFRWLGGIPIDRSKKNNFVEQATDFYKTEKNLMLVIPPQGTRKEGAPWKTGFWHIAKSAKVPVLLGHINYHQKTASIIGEFTPGENVRNDIKRIKKKYTYHSF